MTPAVRRAQRSDASVIAQFNAAMARETEGIELDSERLLAGVEAVLDDSSKGFYLLAEEAGEVIGQLLITYEWSDWRNAVFWWIQSVYVRPKRRGRGVFRCLHERTLELAREQGGVCGLRLYVEKENRRAQQTYRRVGLAETAYQMYEVDFVLSRPKEGR